MKLDTDMQKVEQAMVLLREAGALFTIWTDDDIRDIIRDQLDHVGLHFEEDDVLARVHLTHLSTDDDAYQCICEAVDSAIHTIALNKLGG